MYGILFGLLTIKHFKIIEKYHVIFKYIITLVFILDIMLGYMLGMYKINQGIFHIYFIIVCFLGFWCSYYLHKYVKKIKNNFIKKINQKRI